MSQSEHFDEEEELTLSISPSARPRRVIKNTNSKRFTEEEDAKIVKFLAEKAATATETLPKMAMCEEFVKLTASQRKATGINNRFLHIGPKIQKTEHLDTETKVRILFAWGFPVDKHFLEHLRTEAEVNVDVKNRITLFKGNGLELPSGEHARKRPGRKATVFTAEEDAAILKFVADRADLFLEGTMTVKAIWNNCKTECYSTRQWHALYGRFRGSIAPVMHLREDIDTVTKVKILFATRISVDPKFLEKLRAEASVKTDPRGRIIEYKGNDGLDLNMSYRTQDIRRKRAAATALSAPEPPIAEPPIRVIKREPSPDLEKFQENENKSIVRNVKTEGEETPDLFVLKHLERRRRSTSLTPNIDVSGLVIHLLNFFKTQNSLDQNQQKKNKKELLKKIRVILNGTEDPELAMLAQQMEFTSEEDTDICKYLAERAVEATARFSMNTFWQEYVDSGRTNRTNEEISQRFQAHLAGNIHGMNEFDVPTRAMMLFATRTPVSGAFATLVEEEKILNILAEKCTFWTRPVTLKKLWREFQSRYNSMKAFAIFQNEFKHNVAPKIENSARIGLETRARMLYVTRTSISRRFMEEVNRESDVEVIVNNRMRIIMIRTRDEEENENRSESNGMDSMEDSVTDDIYDGPTIQEALEKIVLGETDEKEVHVEWPDDILNSELLNEEYRWLSAELVD
ncbi:unnamed protein product [Caenorhabditis sp. 36 PRJEB53466]|nr:unnamed protein product [Caenorhabditis sp. 36 PRJEB53466]